MMRAVLADSGGATAVLTALTLAATMGFMALGIEAASSLHEQRQMQDAADAAAIAGALAIRSGNSASPSAQAYAVAAENGFSEALGYGLSVNTNLADARVDVAISRPRTARFGGLIDDSGGSIRASSAAHLEDMHVACILGLAGANAIRINRASDLELDGCVAASADDGISRIRISEADPYRNLSVPPPQPCSTREAAVRSDMAVRSGASAFSFCQGLAIRSGATLRLEPGVYIISGGPLTVEGSARLVGEDVTLLVADGGSINFSEGATITLSAPRSGPWAGVAIAGAGTEGNSRMVAGITQKIVGAVHLPDQSLAFAGSASSPCTQIIARNIAIAGPTRLENRCADMGTIPITDRVARLLE